MRLRLLRLRKDRTRKDRTSFLAASKDNVTRHLVPIFFDRKVETALIHERTVRAHARKHRAIKISLYHRQRKIVRPEI